LRGESVAELFIACFTHNDIYRPLQTCFQLYSSLDAQREIIVFLRSDTNTNSTARQDDNNEFSLPRRPQSASVSRSDGVGAHSRSHGSAEVEDNEYYKGLQRTMNRLSRETSEAVQLASQSQLSERLAVPKYKSEKYSPEARPPQPSRARANSSVSPSRLREPSPQPEAAAESSGRRSSSRPRSAFVPRSKDRFIDQEISYRRSSNMPFESAKSQKSSRSPPPQRQAQKQQGVPKTIVEEKATSVEFGETGNLGDINNQSSYFPEEPTTELNQSGSKSSSFILLSKAIPLRHSPSGPTLGVTRFEMYADPPSRGEPAEGFSKSETKSRPASSHNTPRSARGKNFVAPPTNTPKFVDGSPPIIGEGGQNKRISMVRSGIPVVVTDKSGSITVYSNDSGYKMIV
jgi:hypothetical protein